MKTLRNTVLMMSLALLIPLVGCGGGGGGSAPSLPSGGDDETSDATSAYIAASSASASRMVTLAVSQSIVIGAKGAKAALDASACGIIRSTAACPDGGNVHTIGYGMPTADGCNVDCAAFLTSCVDDGITIDGRIEASAFVKSLGDGSIGFDLYLTGEPMGPDDAGPIVSDGVNPDGIFNSAESVVVIGDPSSPGDFDITTYNASATTDGIFKECIGGTEGLVCTGDAPPVLRDPLCREDFLACEEGAEGDDYCHDVYINFGQEPSWNHLYGLNCLNGCCDDGYPESNICWGTKQCSTHEDCRFPSFAMFCIDGFCQGICSEAGDLRCRHGARCDMEANVEWELQYIDLSELVLPDQFGLCTCPYAASSVKPVCGNGIWEPDGGELCDPNAAPGNTGCGSGLACEPISCAACVEANCSDGSDNDENGYTDCDDVYCMDTSACNELIDCHNGIDDDGDTFVDCDDMDCRAGDPTCCGVPIIAYDDWGNRIYLSDSDEIPDDERFGRLMYLRGGFGWDAVPAQQLYNSGDRPDPGDTSDVYFAEMWLTKGLYEYKISDAAWSDDTTFGTSNVVDGVGKPKFPLVADEGMGIADLGGGIPNAWIDASEDGCYFFEVRFEPYSDGFEFDGTIYMHRW